VSVLGQENFPPTDRASTDGTLAYNTLRVLPVSTSYIHPLTVTLSGTSFVSPRYFTSSFTACSNSAKGRKSSPRALSSAAASGLRVVQISFLVAITRITENPPYPRFFSTKPYASSLSNVNMPQPVCLTRTISCVPRSCSEMTMLRNATCAEAPAYNVDPSAYLDSFAGDSHRSSPKIQREAG